MFPVMNRLRRAVDSFWFLPALMVTVSILLAEALVALDRWLIASQLRGGLSWLDVVSASGSRDILGAVAGSILAVAATSFSITISVLATASSTYGPRLVRNFMADRGNQFVLGAFGATFVYALMVLRTVRDAAQDSPGDSAFVPAVAILVAVLIAVADVAILVYFIHHITDSIQVSTLIERVKRDLLGTVDRLYPSPAPAHAAAVSANCPHPRTPVFPARSGYLQEIDEDGLLRWAAEHETIIRIEAQVGDHLLTSEPLARCDHPEAAKLSRCFTIDDARTPYQDLRFSVQQLEEMAVRALSPSTNDPYTARNALAELAPGLSLLASRAELPEGRQDQQGTVRLITRRPDVPALIGSVFTAVRRNGADHAPVLVELAGLATRIQRCAATDSPLAELAESELRLLREAYRANNPAAEDWERFLRQLSARSPG